MALLLECSVHVAYEKIFACRRGEFIHKLSPYVNVANLSLLLQAAMFENKREKNRFIMEKNLANHKCLL